MERKNNSELVPLARRLRGNMTKQERRLWYGFLSKYPVKFTRQKVLGKYIADFYCARARLVIELDGSQHYEESKHLKDVERTRYIEQFGLYVIRLPNNYINENFAEACDYIDKIIRKRLEISEKAQALTDKTS